MVAVAAAVTVRIHDPAHQHREQDEGDEPANQRPVHGAQHIGAGRGRGAVLAMSGDHGEAAGVADRPRGLRVQRDLLSGCGERPRDLHPALLPEHEPELARGPQAVGVGGPEGCARPTRFDRAKEILMKEAVFAARFRGRGATIRHTRPTPPSES